MNWIELNTENEIEEIKRKSENKEIVIFKHSTSCGISGFVFKQFEKELASGDYSHIDFYLLDLLKFRQISNKVSEVFDVRHESPQVLKIKNGIAVYNESHSNILAEDLIV